MVTVIASVNGVRSLRSSGTGRTALPKLQLTDLWHGRDRLRGSELARYDCVGDDVYDRRVESATEDRVLLAAEAVARRVSDPARPRACTCTSFRLQKLTPYATRR